MGVSVYSAVQSMADGLVWGELRVNQRFCNYRQASVKHLITASVSLDLVHCRQAHSLFGLCLQG